MEAPSFQLIDDDEEDFDWEAAVREIDVACQATASNPPQTPPPPPPFVSAGDKFQTNDRRQLTLDKFIINDASKSNTEVEPRVRSEDDEIRVEERRCFVDIDHEAAKTWIYPDNVPRREYQVAITQTALFSNTLVALPTGLGKTLIAAVVMYNYFRWFPEGKIVFAAPSRPLVMQQIEACHNIVGIPQEWTIDMTGLVAPPKRASLWKSKRVFFVTPQVLEKDIQSGTCLVKYLVCLVIDEAHRAMGNYSYCVAVRELMAVPVDLRILALTATPGSKKETIQQVIDNLNISTLEHRKDSDADVCPYVHDRKTEVIEVPMGKDADEINNLLIEVVRPIASRLCAMGLLPGRDFQTLSPCDLLTSRDKFRQAPPPELNQVKCSEVEGYFGVLITLYHIRKLLSSHGIKPAFEMLEEKLKQGYFARYMTRNEIIQKAKLLMQKSLSHGAPSPKLSKMTEILVDHFRTNNPKNSRVIVFSNFRGSVRDILDSLAHLGDSIKATQFIGQSSGKTLKGQSQKVQQAVLEKFRLGGYNVIVATSIGEEGLDIMEVDLVICFDANISPLRMIQRMGRTGRKHDGRVVVLACEGAELKGYKRKQATSKTVGKHMRNGGMNSFNFHCSPRMIPHYLKPELQFVELSIEEFIRHAKKVKVDSPQQTKYREKVTDAEASLLAKYFLTSEAIKPSLVTFPSFQTCPSRVHRVLHSSRTGWLIDAMQLLQGSSTSNMVENSELEFSKSSRCLSIGRIEQHIENGPEKYVCNSPGSVLDNVVPIPPISSFDKYTVPESSIQHAFTANSIGRSQLPADWMMFDTAVSDSAVVHAIPFDEICRNEDISCDEVDASPATETKSPKSTAAECNLNIAISDLSPRLTSFIESGFVPESPLSNAGEEVTLFEKDCNAMDWKNGVEKDENPVPELTSTPQLCANLAACTSSPQKKENKPPISNEKLSVLPDGPSKTGGISQSPPSPEFRIPLRNLTNTSCSEDWCMSSGKMCRSSERSVRLKRLRRIGELTNEKRKKNVEEEPTNSFKEGAVEAANVLPKTIMHRKVRKQFDDARDFIDGEAEVSSEDVVPDSEDESVCSDSDSYEESFIDDQSNSVIGSGQTEDSKVDMMAIYRRSLLTQSPYQEQQKHCRVITPESVPSVTTQESGKHLENTSPEGCLKSPNVSTKKSVDSRLNKLSCEAIPSNNSGALMNIAKTGSSRRNTISSRACFLPPRKLEDEFCSDAALPTTEAPPSSHQLINGVDAGCTSFSDDQFYEGLDLDELEAQAAKLLSQRTESSVRRRKLPEPSPQNTTIMSSPSFDLGIL